MTASEKVLAGLGLGKPRYHDTDENSKLMRDTLKGAHEQYLQHTANCWMNPGDAAAEADKKRREEILMRLVAQAKTTHGTSFLSEAEAQGEILTFEEQKEFWKRLLGSVEKTLYSLAWQLDADPGNTALSERLESAGRQFGLLQAALGETAFKKLLKDPSEPDEEEPEPESAGDRKAVKKKERPSLPPAAELDAIAREERAALEREEE